MKAVFLDRDGTINEEFKDGGLDDSSKVKLLPGVERAMQILAKLDFGVFIITNQDSIYEKRISEKEFRKINQKIIDLLKPSDVKIIKTYFCPHGPNNVCECHKPKPGMLLNAAKEFGVDLKSSYMIGDRLTDVRTGLDAGTKTILLKAGLGFGNLPDTKPDFEAENLLAAIRHIASS
jgi:D-glycero-D-manno-heptose 1,7-bisphosphate phosphatase